MMVVFRAVFVSFVFVFTVDFFFFGGCFQISLFFFIQTSPGMFCMHSVCFYRVIILCTGIKYEN